MKSLTSKAVIGAAVVIGAAACSSSPTKKRIVVTDSGTEASTENTGGSGTGGSGGAGTGGASGGGSGGVVATGGTAGRDAGEDGSVEAGPIGFQCPTPTTDGGDAGGYLVCADLEGVSTKFDAATKELRFQLPPGARPVASATVSLDWFAVLDAGATGGSVGQISLSVVGNTLIANLPVPGDGIYTIENVDLEIQDVCGVKSSIVDFVGNFVSNPDAGADIFQIHCER